MAFDLLKSRRNIQKTILEEEILFGKSLLLESTDNGNLREFSSRLATRIEALKYNADKLEGIHEQLSLAAGTDNEEEILMEIENDFVCLNLAVDIRIELEVLQNETERLIESAKLSSKSLALERKFDRLLEQAKAQMYILQRQQLHLMETNNMHTIQQSQSKTSIAAQVFDHPINKDILRITQQKICLTNIASGEGHTEDTMMTDGKVTENKPNIRAACDSEHQLTSSKRALKSHKQKKKQKQKCRKVYAIGITRLKHNQPTVSSKRTVDYQQTKQTKRRNRKTTKKGDFLVGSKRTPKWQKWRKSPFRRTQKYEKQKPGGKMGKGILRKGRKTNRRKRRHNYKIRRRHTVSDAVPVISRAQAEAMRRRLKWRLKQGYRQKEKKQKDVRNKTVEISSA